MCQFSRALIRNRDFRWTLQYDVTIPGSECVSRKAFETTSAGHAADGRAPTRATKRVCQTDAQSESRIAPQVVPVFGHLLLILENLDQIGVFPVRQPHENPWQDQTGEVRTLRVAQAFPPCIAVRVEDLC